ncbi:hypothetical protein M501DRAFT_385087 [Patellaria atrata CBS 101060]|uniref:Uncharacterized protein n=1 Tax=Patellaria atrata CBS 101060 TaxID=1346257 RepID=A0A9P4SHV1_9PEZI|nr:hypothetical protein M501DRAFT_385087 [Patellaria atrata CBS 101060]
MSEPPQSPPRVPESTFDTAWLEEDTEFLQPTTRPKAHKAWERKAYSPYARQTKYRKVWKRYDLRTRAGQREQKSNADKEGTTSAKGDMNRSPEKVVKRIRLASILGARVEKPDAGAAATRWDRRRSLYPKRKRTPVLGKSTEDSVFSPTEEVVEPSSNSTNLLHVLPSDDGEDASSTNQKDKYDGFKESGDRATVIENGTEYVVPPEGRSTTKPDPTTSISDNFQRVLADTGTMNKVESLKEILDEYVEIGSALETAYASQESSNDKETPRCEGNVVELSVQEISDYSSKVTIQIPTIADQENIGLETPGKMKDLPGNLETFTSSQFSTGEHLFEGLPQLDRDGELEDDDSQSEFSDIRDHDTIITEQMSSRAISAATISDEMDFREEATLDGTQQTPRSQHNSEELPTPDSNAVDICVESAEQRFNNEDPSVSVAAVNDDEDDSSEVSSIDSSDDVPFSPEDSAGRFGDIADTLVLNLPSLSSSTLEKPIEEPITHLDADTGFLKDFLSRAAASKANKSASIARRSSLINRRDSDAVRPALASPRTVLKDKDTNSPSLSRNYGNAINFDIKLSEPKTYTEKSVNVLSESMEVQDNEPSPRRSKRARSRVPPTSTTSQTAVITPNKISMRRADGSEPMMLRKTEAQELALTTRKNTRTNRGSVPFPKYRLRSLIPDLNDQELECPRRDGKSVHWDVQLVYYQDGIPLPPRTIKVVNGERVPIQEATTAIPKRKLPTPRKLRIPTPSAGSVTEGLSGALSAEKEKRLVAPKIRLAQKVPAGTKVPTSITPNGGSHELSGSTRIGGKKKPKRGV